LLALRPILALATVFAVIASLSLPYQLLFADAPRRGRLVVATTTSLYDTGLLDALEERFEADYGVSVLFVARGTGLAIKQAERGDADVLMVHDPELEFKFMKEGYGVVRKIIAYNYFAIVGPPSDPAGIRNRTVREALQSIYQAGIAGKVLWVSRGDNSGTHAREKLLWKEIGLAVEELRNQPWYVEAGTGMARTLQLTNEKQAYTLADIGTLLRYQRRQLVTLEALVKEDKLLLNVYSVMAVNPDKVPNVNFEDAVKLIRFLVSDEAQAIIAGFGVKEVGRPYFQPAVATLKLREAPASEIMELAFLSGFEAPPEFRHGVEDLYPVI